VHDDKIFMEDSMEAQEYVLTRSEEELASIAHKHGWKWTITPRVLELMQLKLYHEVTTPTHFYRSDFSTLKEFETRLQLHVVCSHKRREMLKLRGLTPTFEMDNPIHCWLWNFLADLQDSPWLPNDCGFDGYFRYWATDLGNLLDVKPAATADAEDALDFTPDASATEWNGLMERKVQASKRMERNLEVEELVADDEEDPAFLRAQWESLHGHEPYPLDEDPDEQKHRYRLEQEELTRLKRVHEEPYDVYKASTTCVQGDDDALDDDDDDDEPAPPKKGKKGGNK
jgi:hypothetical protein